MKNLKRFSLKKFSYTNEDNIRFYYPYSKKLNTPIEIDNFIIVGYGTTCFRNNRNGCINNNSISHLYFRKKDESGKLSNWLYRVEKSYFGNKIDLFFDKFKNSDDFPFYKNILNLVEDDITSFEIKENNRIIHNNQLREKYKTYSGNSTKYKTNNSDDNDDRRNSILGEIRKLDRDISNLNSFESSAPEKALKEQLTKEYNNL